jgi:hypothetical protein
LGRFRPFGLSLVLLLPTLQACSFGYERMPLQDDVNVSTGGSRSDGGSVSDIISGGSRQTTGGTGGDESTAGGNANATGGTADSGGNTNSGGTTGSGGASSGGDSSGGDSSGGASSGGDSSGGASSGGDSSGGASSGGASSGGASSGGDSSGGASSGGASSGGASSGGASSGGDSSGGDSSGGDSSGGASSGGASSGGASSGGAAGDYVVSVASGITLEDAINQANTDPGPQTIVIDPSVSPIVLTSTLPLVTEPLDIIGSGVALDFTSAGGASPCIFIDASDVIIDEIEVFGCNGEPIFTGTSSITNVQILNSYFHDNGQGVTISTDNSLIQGNIIESSLSTGLSIHAANAEVMDNEIYDSATDGLYLNPAADNVIAIGNLLVRSNRGISMGNLSGATIWFNTIVDSADFGISVGLASTVNLQNNIITGSGNVGVSGADSRFSVFDFNLFFNNTPGPCNTCTPGPNTLSGDPLYTNAGLDNYLPSGGPAVDSGVDLLEDRNGATAGDFNGSAPDRGYVETN